MVVLYTNTQGDPVKNYMVWIKFVIRTSVGDETREEMMGIGGQIRALREARGFSLSELAQRSEVSRSYLWKVENATGTNPSIDVLNKLAMSLGTTIAELLGESGLRASPSDRTAPIVPSTLDAGLREFLDERRKDGHPLPAEDIRMLMGLQRRDKDEISRDDWYLLYQVVDMVLNKTRSK